MKAAQHITRQVFPVNGVFMRAGWSLVLSLWTLSAFAARAPQPADCVQVRYFASSVQGAVRLSADGKRVLYLVRSPELGSATDRIQLYVQPVQAEGAQPARLIMEGESIEDPNWLADNTHFTVLMSEQGHKVLVEANADSAQREVLIRPTTGDILAYSIDRNADTLVTVTSDNMPRLSRRMPDGHWSSLQPIAMSGAPELEHVSRFRRPSLSPDGSRVALTADIPLGQLPAQWERDARSVKWKTMGFTAAVTLIVVDLQNGRATLPFPTLAAGTVPVWAADSQSFLISGAPPVNSSWSDRDLREQRWMGGDADLFWVEPASGKIEELLTEVHDHHQQPLYWDGTGDVVLQLSARTIGRYRRGEHGWQETARFDIPFPQAQRYSIRELVTHDGKQFVGSYETPSVSPDLFLYRAGERQTTTLTHLNPQLDELRFATTERVDWKSPAGESLSATLLKPADYVPGKRYPLVIQTKGNQGWFLCDSGFNHSPAFIPQPLAQAGIMYLIEYAPEGWKQAESAAFAPKGYPGQISEAAHALQIWESAIAELDRRGLIDPTRVGIIGFSRTGWHVEFDLAQSRFHFAAATAADNVQYSLSEYWLDSSPEGFRLEDAVYGGPPYGATLKNWLKYSVSFNLDKVHTPLLVEAMGYGVADDEPGRKIPMNLATRYEIVNGLKRLGRPVDLYYYASEDHQPKGAEDRLLTLTRNLDWYRFWLQGYEDPAPAKSEQYRHWERLCDQQRESDPAHPAFCVKSKG